MNDDRSYARRAEDRFWGTKWTQPRKGVLRRKATRREMATHGRRPTPEEHALELAALEQRRELERMICKMNHARIWRERA